MIDSNMDNFAFMLALFYFYLIVLLNWSIVRLLLVKGLQHTL